MVLSCLFWKTLTTWRCAWAGDGELYTTGSNDAGQLGVKGREVALEPIRVSALEMNNVHSVACGQGHMLAVVDNGHLAAWGSNEYGQLGEQCAISDHEVEHCKSEGLLVMEAFARSS